MRDSLSVQEIRHDGTCKTRPQLPLYIHSGVRTDSGPQRGIKRLSGSKLRYLRPQVSLRASLTEEFLPLFPRGGKCRLSSSPSGQNNSRCALPHTR